MRVLTKSRERIYTQQQEDNFQTRIRVLDHTTVTCNVTVRQKVNGKEEDKANL